MSRVTLIRQRDGAALTWDSASLETFEPSIAVTAHPVEEGVDVSDHAQRQPLQFTIRALQSETPFARVSSSGGVQRVLDALSFLRSLETELCTVVTTRTGTITDCLITGYPYEITARRSLPVTLRFTQVRIATAQFVSIPPLQPAPSAQVGFPDEQDAGQQATGDTADDPAKQEQDTSIAYDVLSAVGVL